MARAGQFLKKALSALQAGRLADAEAQCGLALTNDTSNAEAHRLLAAVAMQRANPAKALNLLEHAARLAPADLSIALDLAAAYEAAGRAREAWRLSKQCVAAYPADPRAIKSWAGMLARVGRLEEAEAACRQAIALAPRDADTLVLLGEICTNRGDYLPAESAFAQALDLNPAHLAALRGHGLTLIARHRYAEAAQRFRAVLAKAPTDAQSRISLANAIGAAALDAGRWDEAQVNLIACLDHLFIWLRHQAAPESAPMPNPASRRIHRALYLEVEVKAREFEARVLLALHAASVGMSAVVGQKSALKRIGYERLPPGVVLFKTMNKADVGVMQRAAKQGHLVAVLDEEAFGGSGQSRLWMRLDTDPTAVAATDVIVAQGPEYVGLLGAVYPDAAARAVVLGNPRVDLYRPEFRKSRTAAGSPPYILICAMSQLSNPRGWSFADVNAHILLRVSLRDPFAEDVLAGLKSLIAFELSIIPQIQAAVDEVARALPDIPIVVRPHPSEDPEFWRRLFQGRANVTVKSDGPLTDAFAGARALVYVRGCATGVEGYLEGMALIRFDGDGRAPEPGNWISSSLGMAARNGADIVSSLKRIEAGENTADRDRERMGESFLRESARLVSATFAAGLRAAIEPSLAPESDARDKLLALMSPDETAPQTDFNRAKFPDTDVAEVRALAARFAALAGIAMPRIEALAPNVFLFAPA